MKIVSSSKTENKIPSDVLTLEELRKIILHIPPDVLFKTTTFAYYNQQNINNMWGRYYLEEMKKLDNNIQRYIVFCWTIGCSLWEWNESIFEHEITKPFCDFEKKDWKKANNLILSLAMFGY